MDDIPDLPPEALEQFTDAELAAYVEMLEDKAREAARRSFPLFARKTEVPGVPDKSKIKASDWRRVLAEERGLEVEGDDPDEAIDWYPDRLAPAAHHDLIMETVQALVEEDLRTPSGDIVDGVLVFAPPGSAKSTYSSMLCPAYFMGRFPNFNVIGASYAQSLADRFSRRSREICDRESYREIMGTGLKPGSTGVQNWQLENGSEYRAVGIQAAVTGFRADLCLVGSTMVETPTGKRRLDQIQPGDLVLSYDFVSKRPAYHKVVAKARRKVDELWRVRTGSGHLVEASDNHPFYNGDGWKEASALAAGDVLMRRVRNQEDREELRSDQASAHDAFLQQDVFNNSHQQAAGFWSQHLQQLWKACCASARMFRRMSIGTCEKARRGGADNQAEKLQRMWQDVSASNEHLPKPVLFERMCHHRALESHAWTAQSELARWQGVQQIQGWCGSCVSACEAFGAKARQMLRDVWQRGTIAGSSYRRGCAEQRAREYRDTLRALPLEAPRGRAPQTAPDHVAMVERVCQESYVYDIQVETTHNFFANDILVHNCIIDDPVAGAEEADSEVIREKTWESFQTDLSTRLKPGGKLMVIQTRWHQDDLSGRILAGDGNKKWNGQSGHWKGSDERNWYVICLPMVAEHEDDPLGRAVGDILWPEHFRARDVANLQGRAEREGGTRAWSALYQQRPSISGGNIVRREWWQQWTKRDEYGPIPPECSAVYLFYDTAFEAKETADYSAMTAWGIFERVVRTPGGREFNHHQAVLLTSWQERVDAVELPKIIKKHTERFEKGGTNVEIFVEGRASGKQIIQELRRMRLPVREWLPKGPKGALGKVPRTHAATFPFESGCIWYIPSAETLQVIDQVSDFPNAPHDDLHDTVTMAMDIFRRRFLVQMPTDELDDDEYEEDILRRRAEKKRLENRRLYG
jgi:phage terminase large subunit-like protein